MLIAFHVKSLVFGRINICLLIPFYCTNLFFSSAVGQLNWTAILGKRFSILQDYCVILDEQAMYLLKLLIWDSGQPSGTSNNGEHSSCTWSCKIWFRNEWMSLSMKETGTFVLAGITVRVANCVFKLNGASSCVRIFSIPVNLIREIRQKEWEEVTDVHRIWLNVIEEASSTCTLHVCWRQRPKHLD